MCALIRCFSFYERFSYSFCHGPILYCPRFIDVAWARFCRFVSPVQTWMNSKPTRGKIGHWSRRDFHCLKITKNDSSCNVYHVAVLRRQVIEYAHNHVFFFCSHHILLEFRFFIQVSEFLQVTFGAPLYAWLREIFKRPKKEDRYCFTASLRTLQFSALDKWHLCH